MADNNLTHTSKITPSHQSLTPNERAIIESIRIPILRKLFESIWQTKLRLQFTGWLQYVPPLIVTLVIFLIAGIVHLLGSATVAKGFAFIGYLLLAVEIFDLITVKFRIRPHEQRPKRVPDPKADRGRPCRIDGISSTSQQGGEAWKIPGAFRVCL